MPTRAPAPAQHLVPAPDGGALLLPTDALPTVPQVPAPGEWTYDERRRAFVEIRSGEEQSLSLHPDLFLRVAELDFASPYDALRLINAYGPMGIDPTVALDRGRPPSRSDIWRRREAFFGHAVVYHDVRERLVRERSRLRRDGPRGHGEARVGYEGIEAFASGVATMKEAAATLLWLSGVGPRPSAPPGEAAEVLAVVLDDALSVFAPRVHWQPDDDPAPTRPPEVPLFCVLALQLAHHVAVGEQIRPCRGCGKPIHVAARDPNTAKFLRRNVKYCDDACRNRFHTAQRAERRRQQRASRTNDAHE